MFTLSTGTGDIFSLNKPFFDAAADRSLVLFKQHRAILAVKSDGCNVLGESTNREQVSTQLKNMPLPHKYTFLHSS